VDKSLFPSDIRQHTRLQKLAKSSHTWSCLLTFSPRDMVCRRPLIVPPFCRMAPLSVTRSRWPGMRSGRTLFWGALTLRAVRGSRGYEFAQDCCSSVRLCRPWEVELPILYVAGPYASHLGQRYVPLNLLCLVTVKSKM
jgi:hypothetical protein